MQVGTFCRSQDRSGSLCPTLLLLALVWNILLLLLSITTAIRIMGLTLEKDAQ